MKEPQTHIKLTHKQIKMGFKKPLPFTAGFRRPLFKASRKELSQLGPTDELPKEEEKGGCSGFWRRGCFPFG
ncbi:hypothetical protein MA16_Dca018255 [Dendrobium catenatum]|uniref:Uncharacterized protein n=1 Tax=Dendrobium catenatum TaxID=906689 RepID=A0A2I0XBD0_9ASPA|nr:hypothetical protein MA16_Dca018255 [Dendrobium catenatum]